MDYEKKYNELVGKMKKAYLYADSTKAVLEDIMPELKESEDERIRKVLIEYFNEQCDMSDWNGVYGYQVVAWLEKQGEQENKINSYKITFEDVLALECAMKTVKITKGGNELYELLVRLYNKIHNAYLVEIQDGQKPTHVLDIEIPFGARDSELQEASYYIPEGFHAEIEGNRVVIKQGEHKPFDYENATIVQKDFVPKNERSIAIKDSKAYRIGFADGEAYAKEEMQSSWSEEDEHRTKDAIYFLDTAKKHYASTVELDACIDWIKSIKQRMGG